MITAVILCGGSGTRLWPASRKALPKQFVPLTGERSSFQETLLRVSGLDGFSAPLIVTGEPHGDRVRAQLAGIGLEGGVLIEPEGRESGPAIAAASAYALERDPDAVLLVLAADHHIGDVGAFRGAVTVAMAAAEAGYIVTFGIRPDHPATGYGYIAPGDMVGGLEGVRRVASFAEKPGAAAAREHVAAGYLWNSGNFAFRADALLDELAAFEPAMLEAARRSVALGSPGGAGFRLHGDSFGGAPKKPFDYAVMERTARAVVIPVDMGWSDIGSWNSVWAVSQKDATGNAVSGDALLLDTRNSLVRADGILVAALGVEDLVIAATADAVLVCRRDASQSVREVVEALLRNGRPEATLRPGATTPKPR